MMRTPVKSGVRNANEIGKTPPTKVFRQAIYSTQSSSHQLASILNNRASMSPVHRPNVLKEKQNNENIVASVEKDIDNNLGTGKECSSEYDFITMFTGWLVKTNGKVDTSTFSRIKDDLRQIVGKYELELSQKK